MDYDIAGTFVEACDCRTLCPCWVDDDPDDGHCTGLFAWTTETDSKIDGDDVDGLHVVSVSTHSGNRRTATTTTTVLYVDARATPAQFGLLARAFAGNASGPLAELATVSGTVLAVEQARITVTPAADLERWEVTVTPDGRAPAPLVHASGTPVRFDNRPQPLTLAETALSKELAVDAAVTAQRSTAMTVALPALPGGYVQVEGRSGMRGRFHYRHAGD